jgi:RNA recognition motif-containing protein
MIIIITINLNFILRKYKLNMSAVCVGSFGPNVTEDDLGRLFETCGTVTSVKIFLGKMIKKKQQRYAFIEFAEAEYAHTALLLNETLVGDLPIKVDLQIEKKPPAIGVPLKTVMVCGPHDKPYNTNGSDELPLIVNTTSRTKEEWSKGLSPFFVGPVKLYGGYTATNLENAWQYAKVYQDKVNEKNEPTGAYFKWAKEGWTNPKPVRYPMGHGTKPQYSLWDGTKLGKVDARKKIYAPLVSC